MPWEWGCPRAVGSQGVPVAPAQSGGRHNASRQALRLGIEEAGLLLQLSETLPIGAVVRKHPLVRITSAMNHLSRPRIPTTPMTIVVLSTVLLLAVLVVHRLSNFLAQQFSALPMITACVAGLGPLAFVVWYLLSYAHVHQGKLRVRSIMTKQMIDLRKLVGAEVYNRGRGNGNRGKFHLMLHLEDDDGRQLWLPLNTWRDEDLLMARVLRATVDCKVRIEGDPLLVRRLSGLLQTYKSWDRQLAA
ncbi:MAG: hypothetical protein JWN41_159 [Thermoleophilia bacterium]|nr:hypothetical protein [Thermoleophilia bacterium]